MTGNARVIVVTEGVGFVPFQWYMTYLPLYMVALGVTEVQVGLLTSTIIFTQLISTLFGGYLADRLGRKPVLVVFDIVCWGIPMLLYTVARNPWYFLVGRLINGFVYVVLPAFECLFVEDVHPRDRTAVFSLYQLLVALAGLFAPVSGLLVSRLGIVPAGRVIMGINAVSLVGIAIVRQFTLRETHMGQERMSTVAGQSPFATARATASVLLRVARDRRLMRFLAVRMLVASAAVVGSTYSAIYMADLNGLALPKSAIAWLPFVSAPVTLTAILLAARHIGSPQASFRNMVAGQVLGLAAGACLVASPTRGVWLPILWAAIAAGGTALFQPASQSHWANLVGDRERAMVFSAGSTLVALCTLPAGPIAGALYVWNVRAPFLLGMALQGAALGLIWVLRQRDGCWTTSRSDTPEERRHGGTAREQ